MVLYVQQYVQHSNINVVKKVLKQPHSQALWPGTFYHICVVKGRHDLFMLGWSKLDVHTHSSTSIFFAI